MLIGCVAEELPDAEPEEINTGLVDIDQSSFLLSEAWFTPDDEIVKPDETVVFRSTSEGNYYIHYSGDSVDIEKFSSNMGKWLNFNDTISFLVVGTLFDEESGSSNNAHIITLNQLNTKLFTDSTRREEVVLSDPKVALVKIKKHVSSMTRVYKVLKSIKDKKKIATDKFVPRDFWASSMI